MKDLLKVKSILTLVSTFVFAVLSLRGKINAEQFMQIFSVIVAFYFGTSKRDDTGTDK